MTSSRFLDEFKENIRTFDWAREFLASVPEVKGTYVQLKVQPPYPTIQATDWVDMFHDMDLVCSKEFLDSLESIEFEVGGQLYDRLDLGDAACSFLNDIYGRPMRTLDDGRVRVPLCLCGTTANCLMHFPEYHELRLVMNTKKRDGVPNIRENYEVWATGYTLPTNKRPVWEDRNMVAQQTQRAGAEWVIPSGTQRIRLFGNKTVFSIAFHFGKNHPLSIAKRARMVLTYYDSDAKETLPEKVIFDQAISGMEGGDDYVMYRFLPEVAPVKIPDTMLDLTRVHNQYLELDFEHGDEKQEKIPVYVFFHTYEQPRFRGGMAGLRFSK